ncbi:hypothetical protein, partial [Pseudomonas sp. 2995-1]|uniref:hypothetical protein n=1 Tax=Pseudomonas sp. 2995-1 TaxID=1712679 RepID=UPI000C3509BE
MNSAFEVSDHGDHYVLSFQGEGEEFSSFLAGSTITDVESDWIFDADELVGNGVYQLMIQKDTYYMLGYNLEFEFSGSSVLFGDIETKYKAVYK